MLKWSVAAWVCLLLLGACAEEEVDLRPVVDVKRGPLVFSGSFHGELKAKASQAIHAPQLNGVDFLTVDTVLADGTMVKKDDVVLGFVKGPLEDDLRAAQTDLEVSEAEYQRTVYDLAQERVRLELDVKRKKMAVERAELFVVEGVNLISKLELDKYKLDVNKAKVEHELARKALRAFTQKRNTALEVKQLKVGSSKRKVDEMSENLEHMEIKAPGDGMLYGPYTRLNWVRGKVAPGSVCRPGDKLLEIPDLSLYEAVLHARQRDAALLSEGVEASVFATALPDQAIEAKLITKDDFATTRNERLGTELPENNLKEIRIVLELAKAPEALRPGGTVRADVNVTLAEDVLLLPLAAVQDGQEGSFVILESGEQRPVKLGKASTVHAEVLEGLEEGDRVILAAAEE